MNNVATINTPRTRIHNRWARTMGYYRSEYPALDKPEKQYIAQTQSYLRCKWDYNPNYVIVMMMQLFDYERNEVDYIFQEFKLMDNLLAMAYHMVGHEIKELD